MYHNDDYYIGEWKDGKVNGHGKFVHLKGIIDEGNLKDNFQDGEAQKLGHLVQFIKIIIQIKKKRKMFLFFKWKDGLA